MNQENARELLRDLELPGPERKPKIIVDEGLESTLKSVLQHYKKTALQQCWHQDRGGWLNLQLQEKVMRDLKKICASVTPALIERFILALETGSFSVYDACSRKKRHPDNQVHTMCETDGDDNTANNTGVYISALVQLSYNAGHNDFLFSVDKLVSESALHHLFFQLRGKKENNIKITTFGRTGPKTLILSDNVDMTVYDSLGEEIGSSSNSCIFRSDSKGALNAIIEQAGPDCKFYLVKDGKEKLVGET